MDHETTNQAAGTCEPHGAAVAAFSAYACTVAAVRYMKDGDKAPQMATRLGLMRIGAGRVAAAGRIENVGRRCTSAFDEIAGPFLGCLGEVDERLRPLDWSERVLKTYLGIGLVHDFCSTLASTTAGELGAVVREALDEGSGSEGETFEAFAAQVLLPAIESDPQLAARLGLWGRRVVGEEIGILLRVLEQFPQLIGAGMEREDVHSVLSDGALVRMKGLGLRV